MKKLTIFLIALLAAVVPAVAGDKESVVTFDETVYDFGTISEEDGPVSCVFTFTNEGKELLTVVEAKAQCGCTRPTYPPEPIKPGKKGKIKVTFNPQGRPGEFIKEVKVKFFSGKDYKFKLRIMGVVLPSHE